ncbi:hypothetical protein LOAG_12133 [Loa loa]|uniref:Uncharacterized protein n=1 Tax=Loa loa TaxID=7209 RepID=A0A1S0TLS1_LOALO|nr:hypothetical protein LOAG_12133 [Loa loa]EFO16374.1 hypothetical protein LOAG_12133 [Loa loa]
MIVFYSRLNNLESSIKTSTENPLFGDYDEKSWFGESGVPNLARDPIAQFLALLKKPRTMGNLEALIRIKVIIKMNSAEAKEGVVQRNNFKKELKKKNSPRKSKKS